MFRLILIVVFAGASAVLADIPIDLKPVYFQTIAPRAFVDGRGAVWFLDQTAVHDSIGKQVAIRPSAKHELILVDRAGRFWFRNPYEPEKTGLVFVVGTVVTVTNLAAPARADLASSYVAIHEDSAGRIFVRTPRAVHVLGVDGKWDDLALFDRPSTGFTPFMEDPEGRTWMSVAQNQPKVLGGSDGTVGAWCFDGTTWTNYTPTMGFPFEQVEFILPFADDWFVVLEHVDGGYNSPRPKAALWSPSRTVKEIAAAKVFAGLPTIYALYDGTDLSGNRYLHRPSAAHDGKTSQEAGTFRITPAGVVSKLTEAEERSIRRQTRVHRHPKLPILAKPGDLQHITPETGSYDALGQDKQGRIWFQVHYGDLGSHCLWPAKEKAGDLLRVESHGHRAQGMLLAGGEAWSTQDRFERWDGRKWVMDDPFPAFQSAVWTSRGGPPANYFIANFRSQGAASTGGGGLLAWRVSTKYEGKARERFVPKEEEPKAVDPKAPTFRFRLAIRTDRHWGKPDEPLLVLKGQAKGLVATMRTDLARPEAIKVTGDGVRLWIAYDGNLHTIEANGDLTSVELTKPPEPAIGNGGVQAEQLLPTLLTTNVLPLGENKALVSTAAGSWIATFRATKVREIKLTKLASVVPRNLFRDRNGAVWGWNSLEELQRFDGEKFTILKSCRGPIAFTDDGVLWCHSPMTAKLPAGAKRPVSLVRVCGDSLESFSWKTEEIEVGFTKPPKGSAVVWPSEHGLLLVEAPAKAGERPTLRKRQYTDSLGWSGVGPPFVITAEGEILFSNYWGKLFD